MTRIATLQMNQSALAQLMRAQQQSFEANQQVATGKKAQDLKGYGVDAPVILAARGLQARTESYLQNLDVLRGQAEAQNLALEEAYGAAQSLRDVVGNVIAVDDGAILMNELERVLQSALSALNLEHGGQYLFGGVRADAEPVNIDSVAELVAAPTVDDIFDNADRARVARLDEGHVAETAPLASDAARELFASIKRIAEFDAGPNGPFGGDLTDAQRAFLTGELQNIDAAMDEVGRAVSRNGVFQNRLEETAGRLAAERDRLTGFVSRLEDVDMAEAVSRLQQSQLAVEASARAFATLSRTSLLDFLR